MHHHYKDITSRIAEPPKWFDENAVPRFDDFDHDAVANIYATEVALVEIACQSCGKRFAVAFSWSMGDFALHNAPALSDDVHALHFGDPPNVDHDDACAGGATMNAESIRVLEFWRQGEDGIKRFEWSRDASLEINIDERSTER